MRVWWSSGSERRGCRDSLIPWAGQAVVYGPWPLKFTWAFLKFDMRHRAKWHAIWEDNNIVICDIGFPHFGHASLGKISHMWHCHFVKLTCDIGNPHQGPLISPLTSHAASHWRILIWDRCWGMRRVIWSASIGLRPPLSVSVYRPTWDHRGVGGRSQ